MHQARKAGYKATVSDVICFLDADDRLAAAYIQQGLAEFIEYRVAVVYSDVAYFGNCSGRSSYPAAFDAGLLQCDNYMHAGSLVRREALALSKVFDRSFDPLVTQGDWFLWRHVLQANWTARKQRAV